MDASYTFFPLCLCILVSLALTHPLNAPLIPPQSVALHEGIEELMLYKELRTPVVSAHCMIGWLHAQ